MIVVEAAVVTDASVLGDRRGTAAREAIDGQDALGAPAILPVEVGPRCEIVLLGEG